MRLALALGLVLLVGCPPDPSEPTRPDTRVCDSDDDCASDGGGQCGEISICVDLRCERDPSRFVPCP
jgi:hypothetical protein